MIGSAPSLPFPSLSFPRLHLFSSPFFAKHQKKDFYYALTPKKRLDL